ncbi:MAG: peptidylprolyl isomerase [Xanthomonadaceae bacterium]|nr:peptidylprolyl isomerase [Xanthomonadaceae bacterium]
MRKFGTLVTAALLFVGASSTALERELELQFESPLLATRGDARVSQLDFVGRMQAVPAPDRAGVVSDPERIGKLLEEVLLVRELADRAIEGGILEDPAIQAELHYLLSVRLSERYRENLLAERELDDYTQQARELYRLNPERYRVDAPSISFSHILLAADGAVDAADPEATARELLAQVKNGESMQALAQQYSDDPSVERNQGLLEAVDPKRLDAQFRTGIERLKEGEVGLVESAYGWHVVRVEEVVTAGVPPFDEIAEQIKTDARQQHRGEIWEREMRKIHEPELEIAEGAISELLDRFPPPSGLSGH